MVILIVIFLLLLIPAATWWFGLWNNFLTLINFLIAALFASSYYENIATKLIEAMPDYAKLCHFLALWILFVLSFIVCRIVTEALSPFKMRFDIYTEMVGRSIFSLWIACVFIAFTLFSFHMAPWHPDAFQKDVESYTLGIGPDRMWLGFIQSRSRGALAASLEPGIIVGHGTPSTHPDDAGLDVRVFDPGAKFIDKWHAHRAYVSQVNGFK